MGGGGNVTALKLKDRQRDATASLLFFRFVLLPSSLQPHLVVDGVFFGLVIPYVWVAGGYFWYPCGEGVTPAVGHPAAPSFLGVWNHGWAPEMTCLSVCLFVLGFFGVVFLNFFFGGGGQAR